jgi:hypothetical protein
MKIEQAEVVVTSPVTMAIPVVDDALWNIGAKDTRVSV